MHDSAERVNVALWGVSGQLRWLPDCCSGGIVGGEIQRCVAEVCKDDVWIFEAGCEAEEDITGFDVAMADTSTIALAASGVETSVQELEG